MQLFPLFDTFSLLLNPLLPLLFQQLFQPIQLILLALSKLLDYNRCLIVFLIHLFNLLRHYGLELRKLSIVFKYSFLLGLELSQHVFGLLGCLFFN